MRIHDKLALLTVSAVLAAAPAVAVAAGPQSGGPPDNQGTAHRPADAGSQSATHKPSTPGPKASLPAKAKAYGRYCQGESKKHVAGQRGTPFSRCVSAAAKLKADQSSSDADSPSEDS
jgi:hypothetical protein